MSEPLSPGTATFLAALRTWPQLALDDATPCVTHVRLRAGHRRVADVVHRPPELRLQPPPDALQHLSGPRPPDMRRADVLVFDLEDEHARATALSVMARLAERSRFAWQEAVESP